MLSKKNFLALLIGFRTASAIAGNLTVDENEIDFGEKFQFTEIAHDVKVWNNSKSVIVFVDQKASDAIKFDRLTLNPKESTTIHLTVPLANHVGYFGRRIVLTTEESGKVETYPILIKGFVHTVIDDIDPGVDFGVIDLKAPKVEKVLSLSSEEAPKLRVVKVLEAPEFVDARVDESHNQVVLTSRETSQLGIRKGVLKIIIDTPQQREVWANVLMDIHGNVVPDQNPLAFGVQRPSTARPVRLQLHSRDHTAFSIEKFSVDPVSGADIKPADCLPKSSEDCHAFVLELDKDRPQGQVSGSITIELAESRKKINVLLAGLFLSEDTKIRSLDDLKSDSARSVSSSSINLSSAISKVVDKEANLPPPGNGPVLKWNVANESGMFGYAIYRSHAVNGSFSRINDEIVKARNEGDNSEAAYQYRDSSAEPGKEYWYYITIFYNSGKKVQLTGPQKVVAK